MRNSNVELLRFILMVGICLLHTLFLGNNLGSFASGIDRVDFFVVACVIPAVNVFMLISGYFGIKTTLKKILYFIFYGFLVYVLLFIVKATIWHRPVTMIGFIRNALPISTFVWWFFTYYFMIMLLAPFINKGCAVVSKKYFQVFLLLYFVVNSLGLYWCRVSDGSNFQTLLFLYLVGRYISLYEVKWNRFLCVGVFAVGTCIIAFAVTFFYNRGSAAVCRWIYCYNNPVVVISSISALLFIISFKARTNKFFTYLGKHSFLIYLLTTKPLFIWWGKLYSLNIACCLLSIIGVCFLISLIDAPLVVFCKWCVEKISCKISYLKE